VAVPLFEQEETEETEETEVQIFRFRLARLFPVPFLDSGAEVHGGQIRDKSTWFPRRLPEAFPQASEQKSGAIDRNPPQLTAIQRNWD
jgi:hypothetical protein